MADPVSQPPRSANTHLLHQQKKLPNGSPKTAHETNKILKSNITKIATGTRTGDAVSDESDDEANDGDSSAAEDDEDDDDDPDVLALPAANSVGNNASSRLAGLSGERSGNFYDDDDDDDETMVGAEPDFNTHSDDEVYDAVADISDSDSIGDADESSILRSAEQDLIAEFERSERPGTAAGVTDDLIEMSLAEESLLARRLSLRSDASQDDLKVFDHTRDPFLGLDSEDAFYKAMVSEAHADFYEGEIASWRMPERENSIPLTAHKKVRFEETASSRSSSVSSEEDPRDSFPDLFDEQDVMVTQHQILLSDPGVDRTPDNESVFDFDYQDEIEKAEFERNDESDSEGGVSDSDSDIGDTTDEETPEEQLARVQKLKASKKGIVPALGPIPTTPRTPATSKRSSPNLSRSNSNVANTHYATPKSAGRPKSGTFACDPTRASVTAGVSGSGVKLVCPRKPPEEDREYWNRARQAMSSRDGSPGGSVSWIRATPRTASIPQRPFTAKSTLGTMFDGDFDFLRSNDEHGIAKEILRPSRKNSVQSSFTSNTLTDDGGADEASNVNMADFVQMDDSDSEMEEPSSASMMMPPDQPDFFNESMFELSPTRDTAAGLLNHFDQQRGLVSSFRNNQHIARHVSSLPANPARRAQLSEANALQQGRRSAANTPMTPARKKRQDSNGTGAGIRKPFSPSTHKSRPSRGNSLSGIQANLAMEHFSGNRT